MGAASNWECMERAEQNRRKHEQRIKSRQFQDIDREKKEEAERRAFFSASKEKQAMMRAQKSSGSLEDWL